MVDEEEIELPPRRYPTLADVGAVVTAFAVGVAVTVLLFAAAARESFDNWRRERAGAQPQKGTT